MEGDGDGCLSGILPSNDNAAAIVREFIGAGEIDVKVKMYYKMILLKFRTVQFLFFNMVFTIVVFASALCNF